MIICTSKFYSFDYRTTQAVEPEVALLMVLGNWVQYTRFVTVHCRAHPEHRCRVMHYSIEYDAVVEKQSIDACPTDQRDKFASFESRVGKPR